MNKKWVALIVCVFFAAALVAGCGGGQKAEKYPTKPITMYINYGAGGSTDLSARSLAKAAEKHLGVSIVAVNKPGANGVTGVTELKNAPNDGRTIGVINFCERAIIPNQTKDSLYTRTISRGSSLTRQYQYCVASRPPPRIRR
jgi:tripartite-type tricarboxylate transporter receptor subunit TctC